MCSSSRVSATGMFASYHFFQLRDLSPATSSTAFRSISKAKRIRNSDRTLEPGRNSFMFLCRGVFTESTSGRPNWGPRSSNNSSVAITFSKESRRALEATTRRFQDSPPHENLYTTLRLYNARVVEEPCVRFLRHARVWAAVTWSEILNSYCDE